MDAPAEKDEGSPADSDPKLPYQEHQAPAAVEALPVAEVPESQNLVSNPLWDAIGDSPEDAAEGSPVQEASTEGEKQQDLAPEGTPAPPPLQEVLDELVSKVDAACGTTPVAERHGSAAAQVEEEEEEEPAAAAPQQQQKQQRRQQQQRKMAAAQALQLQSQLHRTANNAILLKKNLTKVGMLVPVDLLIGLQRLGKGSSRS